MARYPFLDVTVLDDVRGHAIADHAALLFDSDLANVLWTNGEGAALLGEHSVRAVLDGEAQVSPIMLRQIEGAVRKLGVDDDARSNAVMRVRQGFRSVLLAFTLRRTTLPDGTSGLLLLSEAGGRNADDALAQARVAVGALDGNGHASAVLDAAGGIVAASKRFETLGVEPEELAALATEVAGEADRLVKRPVRTAVGEMPCGIARLREDPAVHLVVIAHAADDESEADLPAAEADRASMGLAASAMQAPVVAPSATITPLRNWYYSANKPAVAEDEAVAPSAALAETAKQSELENDDAGRDSSLSGTIAAAATRIADASLDAFDEDADAVPEEIGPEEIGPEQTGTEPPDAAPAPEGFSFSPDERPTRFVWDMDAAGNFGTIGPALAATVGGDNAVADGENWASLSQRLGFDNGDEIARLLAKGDTWSGKTVMWPVQDNALLVPVDLAGLPSYGRNRGFEGFNGFGIIRTADAVPTTTAAATASPTIPERDVDEATEDAPNETVVQLMPRNAGPDARELSPDERKRFAAIGERLAEEAPTSDGAAPVQEASAGSGTDMENLAEPVDKDATDEVLEDTGTEDTSAPIGFLSRPTTKDVPQVSKSDDELTVTAEADVAQPEPGNEAISENEETGPADESPAAPLEADAASPDEIAAFVAEATPTHPVVEVPEHSVDTSILSRLPIPVLVYRDNQLLFANPDFFNLTGYATLPDMALAGGVETLFGIDRKRDGDAESGAPIYHADGERLDVKAHIQRVPWDDARAMLLTLRRNGGGGGDGGGGGRRGKGSLDYAAAKGETDTPANYEPPAFGGLGANELRSILDTATDGVVILSADGTVRTMNRSAEALFDMAAQTAENQPLTSLLAPESHGAMRDWLAALDGPGVESLMHDGREMIARTSGGGLVPIVMTIGRLGNTNARCAVMRDITAWKKSEEELLQAKAMAENASGMKSEFLARISHEIRTPLNAIIGFSDLMIAERFGRVDNERYRGYLRDIHSSGNHVLEIVNDLLDLSKIEAGKMDLSFDACDLNTIASNTVAMMQVEANKERVIIRTSLSAVVPRIVADPRSLRQIILNLVSNGVKFTKAGGQVIVSTVYEDNGGVVLRVRDTGVGMSKSELTHAMAPFQQVIASPARTVRPANDSARRSGQELGTGLGLPLTRALVEANRADFRIDSEPDEGTLVEVRFPSQRVLADRNASEA